MVALLVAGLLPVVLGGPARAAETATASPLTVRLVRLAPASIPTQGRIVLAGTVRNDSVETWTAVNVHPFISRTPLRTREELAAAAGSDPETEVGTRLIDPGQFTAIGDLEPGQTQQFRISLPVKDLLGTVITGESGVYWIGVHALGQNSTGRDTLADGRARTFIPLVRGSRTTSVALVVPVREPVRRDREGRVLGTAGWSDSLAPTGRLGRLGGFVTSAGTRPLSLLIDPAVLDAVTDLKNENPALSFGEVKEQDPGDDPSSTPGQDVSRSSDRLDPADRANADMWLTAVTGAARSHSVLGLGYGDPDASSLTRRRPTMFELASKLAAETFADQEIPAVPTVAPPDGWLDDDALVRLPQDSMVLVSDHGAPRSRTQWRTTDDQDLIFSDSAAATGGPGPTEPLEALALRQRILADAALRIRDSSAGPLVVTLPSAWDPGTGWQLADFFNELDQTWIDLENVTGSTDASTPTFDAVLGYPTARRREEIDSSSVASARGLVQTTTVLAKLLRTENDVAHDLAGIALNAVSYHARADQIAARADVVETTTRMRAALGKVEVIGTDFVTLSGGSGTLAVTLVNGLEQPITVSIEPLRSTGGVSIEQSEPLEMAPGQRTVLRLKAVADAKTIGVTQVDLTPTTADGTPFGSPLSLSIRTSQVGNLIWGVLGAGALLLVVMIGLRIRRGLREHRWRRA